MTGALDALRVVELGGIDSGPYTGILLADLSAEVVRIERPAVHHCRGTVRATKNHRMRSLELPAITLPAVERLAEAAGPVPKIPPLDDRELGAERFRRCWLIQTSTSRQIHDSAYNKALKAACEAAEIPHISSHWLRYAYVS